MQLVRMQRNMHTGRPSYCSGLDIIGCLGLSKVISLLSPLGIWRVYAAILTGSKTQIIKSLWRAKYEISTGTLKTYYLPVLLHLFVLLVLLDLLVLSIFLGFLSLYVVMLLQLLLLASLHLAVPASSVLDRICCTDVLISVRGSPLFRGHLSSIYWVYKGLRIRDRSKVLMTSAAWQYSWEPGQLKSSPAHGARASQKLLLSLVACSCLS